MKVLLFAVAREAAGGRSSLELAGTSTPTRVGELLDLLTQAYPALGPVLRRSKLAINGEYVPRADRSRALAPRDEVAVLPPYSGG